MQPMNAVPAALRVDVRRFGSYLSTRATAERLRNEVEQEIRSTGAYTVAIDFTDVEAITISFADEFIGRLMTTRAAGDLGEPTITIIGLNDEVEEALDICLQRRNALALAYRSNGAQLLGGERHEIETLDVALTPTPTNAASIAARLGITAQNVNNRLKRLTDYGALHRTRDTPATGGREYLYTSPPTTPSPTPTRRG